jgi:hypothetical protein
VELGIKIPIECKATLVVKRRHTESVVDYLRTTHQPLGVLVSASPLDVVYRGEGCRLINIPAYLANRQNILRYAEAHRDVPVSR